MNLQTRKKILQEQDKSSIMFYASYIKTSLSIYIMMYSRAVFLTASIASFLYTSVNNLAVSLAIHALFLFIYFFLAVTDMISGIAASLYVHKRKFSSAKFLKKIFLVGFCLILMAISVGLTIVFETYGHSIEYFALDKLLEVIVFGFHLIKITLMLGFIIYEFTSIRENFLTLGLPEFVWFIDLIITPLKKLNTFLDKLFEKRLKRNLDGK